MTALRGLAFLLLLQAAGEALTHTMGLPFPGPHFAFAALYIMPRHAELPSSSPVASRNIAGHFPCSNPASISAVSWLMVLWREAK